MRFFWYQFLSSAEQMSCHPNIQNLITYGLEAEAKLTEIISNILGEPMKKTASKFDCLDFQGVICFAELKRRSNKYFYTDPKIKKEGWLIPSCKIIRGWDELNSNKRVYFFYLWMADKSLWIYEMKQGDFASGNCHKIPPGHYDNQLHVAIHQDMWKRVDIDLSSIEFDEETCHID